MGYSNWTDTTNALKEATANMTPQQSALATHAGLTIDSETPHIVAAAILRIALSNALALPESRPTKDYVVEALTDLGKLAQHVVSISDHDIAEAWLTYFRLTQRLKILSTLMINEGDVVQINNGDLVEVSSFDGEGRVFLKGGRGLRVWPDEIISIEGRHGDNSVSAERNRTAAENLAALRNATPAWSVSRSDDLREYEVTEQVTVDLIDELESVVLTAKDEAPIQQFLQLHRGLLPALLGGRDRYCMPQVRLGSQYVADFIMGDVDSLGVRWVLVELETPRSAIYLSNGKALDKFARKGVDQITEWRSWLQDNIAYAHRSRLKDGLGLPDISNQSEAIVLVGSRSKLVSSKDAKRRELRERLSIHVHTYDWLLERLRGAISFRGPTASNPHVFKRPTREDGGR